MSLQAATGAVFGGSGKIALRYIAVALGLNLAWEAAQMPLYTIWRTGSPGEILFAILHCTAGDVLIATASLFLALLLVGNPMSRLPSSFGAVPTVAVLLGVAYTVFSEWLNISVRGSWAYAPAMPVLPPLGTGLTPLLQWVVIPPLALGLAGRWRRMTGASEAKPPGPQGSSSVQSQETATYSGS